MKILITGGAGYIGSCIAEKLFDQGNDIVIVDNLSHGRSENVHTHAEFVRADISDRETLIELFGKHNFDAVIHLAAFIEVGESVHQPGKYLSNNFSQTLVLLEAMREAGVKNILYSSSAAVYGYPQIVPIDENQLLLPINPYGLSKLMVEQALAWYAEAHGFKYAALRYFNAAGATKNHGENHNPETHLIPLILDALIQGKEFNMYGSDYDTADGTAVRDYVHVEDIADAHLLMLKEILNAKSSAFNSNNENLTINTVGYHAYNVGSGRGYSVKEIIAAVEKVTGQTVKLKVGPRRAGDPATLVASTKKIAALGWQPKHSLESIIQSAWDWQSKHQINSGS